MNSNNSNNLQIVRPNNYYNILNSIIQKSVDYYSSDDEIEQEQEEQQISIFEQNLLSKSPEPESLPSESPEPIQEPRTTLTIENGAKIKFEREVEQPELIFPNQSNYQYEILEILSDEENVEKPKPKSNFYKYAIASGILGSVVMITSFSVSYFFSKKRNKNKN
jgi:hypothetical protein